MALTKVSTDGVKDDAVTTDKLANAINTERTANTAKDLTALSASNLTSGTVPDARFPDTLPAKSAANLTNIPAANITGTLPAVSAANLTNIPAANITGTLPAISGANLTNLPPSGKTHNHIYNGAMQISQRGDAHQNVGNDATTYTLDRWRLYVQNTSARFQVEKNYDHSLPDGFKNSMRISCTTTDTSLAATDEVQLIQSLEGFDVMAFAKGTSSAKQYTLSFYARSTKTGTYCVTLLGRDNTTSTVSKSYTMSSTWTRHVITFPADTNGNRKDNDDNGEALRIVWWLVAGSGVNNGTLQETWTNSTDTGRATGQVNFADSTNEFYITGVQLEVGDTVSDFAYEDYCTTLAKCQRYYQVLSSTDEDIVGSGFGLSNGMLIIVRNLLVEMRTLPSIDDNTSGSTRYRGNYNTDSNTGNAMVLNGTISNNKCLQLQIDGFSSVSNGTGCLVRKQGSSALLGVSAEL